MGPPYPAPTHRVHLHLKVLYQPPAMTPDAMVAYMRDVYAPYGIDVVIEPTSQNLSLVLLEDLRVGKCTLGVTTAHQEELFENRVNVPPNQICIYFIRSTDAPLAGCSSLKPRTGFPNGRATSVLTKDATPWTLGHECGHLLGLRHVVPPTQVMVSGTWRITVDPPMLDPVEVDTIKKSPFVEVINPGTPPPPPPQPSPPKPPPDENGADAIHRTTDEDGGLADRIRRDLDQDDGLDYDDLAGRFGAPAVEALSSVVCGSRARIAAGAVTLAALLDGGVGFPVVAQGSANVDPVVRVAAAASARRLPATPATIILARLLEDRDVGVRGHAVRSSVEVGAPELRERVEAIRTHDASPALRELAAQLLDRPGDSAS